MMKPASDTPTLPGVYALIHRASGATFIGASENLRQRRTVWKSYIRRGLGSTRQRGFPDFPLEQWEWKIVVARAGMTSKELTELAAATIAKALGQGLTVINRAARPAKPKPTPNADDPRARHIRMMPVKILDDAGAALTYTEAGQAIGRSAETVKQMVKRANALDPRESITIAELRTRAASGRRRPRARLEP